MMKQATLALLLTACLAPACGAQTARPWQHLQFPTVQQVQAKWLHPSSVYGPEPYYGLNGPVTLKVVERDLDTMHRLGFRAVTIQAGRGMPFPYLSKQYFKFFHQVVEQAKKRNMRVWIVDDAGYPSGFAGGAFTRQMPKLRMQGVEIAQTLHVAAGKSVHLKLDPDSVSAAAVNVSGQATPIPLHGRTLNWTAPAGS
ncbi:MAG: glycosyl hydrolase, partial [Acidobacteriaceae bacterium]